MQAGIRSIKRVQTGCKRIASRLEPNVMAKAARSQVSQPEPVEDKFTYRHDTDPLCCTPRFVGI